MTNAKRQLFRTMNLRRFVSDKQGNIKRGAFACVSKHLGVPKGTIRNWINGVWKPGKETQERIDAMIRDKIDLQPDYSRCGRKKREPRSALVP